MRIFILNFFIGIFSSEFLSRSFFHRTTRNLFGDFLLRRLLTDFRRCDLSGRCRYPRRFEKVPQISQIYTDFSWDVFFVTQISQMTQIFFSWDFIHRTTQNLFGDFLLRRLLTDFRGGDLSGRCRYPLRLENVPQISQIYTDFSWDVFCHADFADDADFFSSSDDTEFIRISCCDDYSRNFAETTCSVVADTPWDRTKRFTRDSIKNLCISVKSVGQK